MLVPFGKMSASRKRKLSHIPMPKKYTLQLYHIEYKAVMCSTWVNVRGSINIQHSTQSKNDDLKHLKSSYLVGIYLRSFHGHGTKMLNTIRQSYQVS